MSSVSTNKSVQDEKKDHTVIAAQEAGITLREHWKPLRWIFQTKITPVPETRQQSPKDRANWLSQSTWAWVEPLLRTGFDRILEVNDAWTVADSDRNELRLNDYRKRIEFYDERERRTGKHVAYKEFWAMLYALRWLFIATLSTSAVYLGGEIGISLMSRSLIQAVTKIYEGKTTDHGPAVGYVIGSVLVSFVFQWVFVWNGFRQRYFAEVTRTTLISAVFDKVVRLSPAGRQMYPASKITALITTDTNRVFMAARWTGNLLLFIPGVGGMLGVLIHNLGVSALPGFGLVMVGIVANVFISRIITRLRRKSLPYADRRIGTVRETVENMRVIKFYGWESSFVDMVSNARKKETGFLKMLGLVEGLTDATLTSIPMFGGVVSFAVRIATGHALSPELAFPSLTLFQMFVPLSMIFSVGVTSHADAWASVKRLDEFFRAPEEPNYVITDSVEPGRVAIKDAEFKWDMEMPTLEEKRSWLRRLRFYKRKQRLDQEELNIADSAAAVRPTGSAANDYEEEKEQNELSSTKSREESEGPVRAGARKFPGLKVPDLQIAPRELIMVVGPIGSGKTTLLSTIVGTVSKLSGSVEVGGDVSAVMSTWSQNSTIRDNIIFHKEFDARRYDEVVHVCSLESDFAQFSGRDFVEVGERGITLSGGQKARIALARCAYNGGDVILLDDVLSAVDGKVANHIFEKCVKGFLKDSTRIMATHNLKLLTEADRIVYMLGNGECLVGTLSELMATSESFKIMYMEGINAKSEDVLEEEAVREYDEKQIRKEMELNSDVLDDEIGDDINIDDEGAVPTVPDSRGFRRETTEIKRQASRAPTEVGQKLVQEEARKRGVVSWSVLLAYFRAGSRIGLPFLLIVWLVSLSAAACQAMQTVFLQFWTSNKYHHKYGVYIGYYCLILVIRMAFFVGMAVSLCIFCFNSSSFLHNRAIKYVYRAPMSYFDSTPLGRIINRFTDDTANLDTQMYMLLRMTLFSSSMLIASLVIIFVFVPWAILALVPIFVIGFLLLNYYRASSRELKRINGVFRSGMFSVVTETITGLTVILGFKRQGQYQKILNDRIDDMNTSFQVNLAAQYWLSFRVVMCTLFVNLITMMLSAFQVFGLNPSQVGMILTLLPSLSISVVLLLPMVAELENQFNSVERLYDLAYELPQEAAYHVPETTPPPEWPQNGVIDFEGTRLRYRPELPDVLKGINLHVNSNEKIGICGRTGAGKSTILSALFRITELSGGKIVIDGVDIAQIGLGDLRQKLSIIPQDPVLFQGTIRSNLDPFNQRADVDLWDALRRSGVIRNDEFSASGVSKSHKFHLDTKIDSDGSNFSLGERQLLTLARALVRNSRIIVLDEATATVDFSTDRMIQQTITREFSNCTILCIAHRLQTILHYDRIMVMEAGEIVELGEPHKLFENSGSRFAAMCQESNITEEDFRQLTP